MKASSLVIPGREHNGGRAMVCAMAHLRIHRAAMMLGEMDSGLALRAPRNDGEIEKTSLNIVAGASPTGPRERAAPSARNEAVGMGLIPPLRGVC